MPARGGRRDPFARRHPRALAHRDLEPPPDRCLQRPDRRPQLVREEGQACGPWLHLLRSLPAAGPPSRRWCHLAQASITAEDQNPLSHSNVYNPKRGPTLSESSRLPAMWRYWWNKPEALRRSPGVRSSKSTKATPLRLLKKSVGSSQSDLIFYIAVLFLAAGTRSLLAIFEPGSFYFPDSWCYVIVSPNAPCSSGHSPAVTWIWRIGTLGNLTEHSVLLLQSVLGVMSASALVPGITAAVNGEMGHSRRLSLCRPSVGALFRKSIHG